VLAVSCRASRRPEVIDDVRRGRDRLRRLFDDDQERSLLDCSPIRVNLDALTLLRAIAATRWEARRVGGVDDVRAERWTVDDLDFLELSARRDGIDEAEEAQRRLEDGVVAAGLQLAQDASKTQRVLEHRGVNPEPRH
jgi:hypothetical protein